jgi:hypothetical protein
VSSSTYGCFSLLYREWLLLALHIQLYCS